MPLSLPSREVYTVDIPEIDDFTARFSYNFFTPDESVNDVGGVPEQFLIKDSGEIDADFVQFSTTRAPRFVEFTFTPKFVNSLGRTVDEEQIRTLVNGNPKSEFLIAENLDKIMSEDQFSSETFVSVNFHDGEINDKIYDLISGSIEQHALDEDIEPNSHSHYRAAKQLGALLPNHIKPHYLTRHVSSLQKSTGARFYVEKDSLDRVRNTSPASRSKQARKMTARNGRGTQLRLQNKWFNRLNNVKMHVQINSKLFSDVINRQIKNPNSPFGDDLHTLHRLSKTVQNNARARMSLLPTEEDFKTIVPFVDIIVQKASHITNKSQVEIVGYLIDKTEITKEGNVIDHEPLIVNNPFSDRTVDYRVRYGSRYKYEIRVVALFSVPAIDDDTGDIALVKTLISSRPSNTVYANCVETEAPPPPSDLNFTFDYESEKLLIHWAFPPNAQRDVKKFQVFRRKSISEPFELMKMYDFDDSAKRFENREEPDPSLVEFLSSPALYWIDDDFIRTTPGISYIYAVACIDAHGFTSNYSAQFKVGWDIFKNKLTKELISHSGAPKPYPNLYLERDTFVDTIRVSGVHTRKMNVYFNPEYYYLFDDNDKRIPIFESKQRAGFYTLQILNLDNQKSDQIKIEIDDRIRLAGRRINFPRQKFARRRRLRVARRQL